MKTVAIAYCPSASDPRFHTAAFLQNLRDHPPAGDLLLFSDHDHPSTPSLVKLKSRIDIPALKTARIIRPGTGESVLNVAAVNNLVFLTALRIADRQGYTHFLYLEEDCRVQGHGWDQRLFAEFFSQPRHLLAAGSLVAYNPYNHCLRSARRFERLLKESEESGRRLPIPIYGWMAATSGQGSNIFVNGAGGIYSIAGLKLLFPEREHMTDPDLAAKIWAWDFEIGLRLWKNFGPGAYELLGYLPSVFSGYGNVLTTEEDRLALLQNGWSLIHQVKSNSQPIP